ncbi:VanZ family protein [Lactobacillus terrae]|uniref:VanZ family protein n=1 Tax=Lactobacillus terrae TaxID=2269374 RepID=UPI000C1B66FE|nr:VanZ family protein [Lactobacillus terrae]
MDKKIIDKQKWFAWIVVLIEGILFYSSSMTYKQQTSVPFLEKNIENKPLYHFLNSIKFNYGGKVQSIENDGYYHFVEFFIRKGAHFGIYLVLGIFLVLFLYKYFENNHWLLAFVGWMTTTGLAAFDEFHQGLTGGRSPMVEDVILDSMGALFGIAILLTIIWIIQRRNTRKILN